MERDTLELFQKRWLIISTHTLTWSVTTDYLGETDVVDISTHTLTWSVTGC